MSMTILSDLLPEQQIIMRWHPRVLLQESKGGAAMRPLEQWCRLQREIFRAQLGRLEGHLPNPFNDYHEPLLFADTPVAKEKLREWIATLDQLPEK